MKRAEIPIDRDGHVDRNRQGRWFLLLGTFFVLTVILVYLGWMLGSAFTDGWKHSWGFPFLFGWIGFVASVNVMQRIFPKFWVVVPQNSAFVTTSMLGSKDADPNIPYGPGGHPAYPWEMREESGNITLDIFTLPFHEVVPTMDAAMVVDGLVQFKFRLSHINRAIGIDESTIAGFVGQINEYISNDLAPKSGAQAKAQVTSLRDRLEVEFEKTRSEDLLDEYGLMVTGFQITSIDFPKAVQDVKDAQAQAAEISGGVLKILGCKDQAELDAHLKSGIYTAQDVRKAREEFLSLSGKLKIDARRIDVTGMDKAGAGGAVAAGLWGDTK